MIKKIFLAGAVAVVGFTTFTAFEEKTDEQIITEKLDAKKAEFSAMKQAECDERAYQMALGMVDSLVTAKKAAMAPVKGATKPVTKPKGSSKPSTKPAPAPAPTTKPAPTPTQEKKDKMSGGTQTEEKKEKMEGGSTTTEKKKAKMNSGGGGN